jgi:Excalibur calcium-binding domain
LKKVIAAALLSLGIAAFSPTSTFAAPDKDCTDFSGQQEAQQYWDQKGYSADHDPERLDRDGDGIPCEAGEGSGQNSGTDTSDNNTNGNTNNDTKAEQPKGGKMPKTALDVPVGIMMGLLSLVTGFALFFRKRVAG